MEVREGYKKTEVGEIPEDWEVKSCEEICLKIQDGTHFSPILGGNDYLYITSKNIGRGIFDISNAERIDALQHKNIFNRCDVRKGDLLLTKDGANTGNAALNHLDEEFSLLSSVAFLRFDLQKHESSYYLQQILSPDGQKRIKEVMVGNAITRLTLEKIRKLKFPVPSLDEQTAIANVLSDADALINNLEKLIAKKQNIKQGAMQQLLTGQKRLPGFGGEWEEEKVRDFGGVITGSTPSTIIEDYWNGEIPWVTPTDINNKRDVFQSERQITPLGVSVIRKLPRNSVLVTCIASIGKNAILRTDGGCNQQINAIVPNQEHNAEFLYYLFEGNKPYLLGHAGITATNIISKKDFSEITFSVPSFPEQLAIAQVLSDMDIEIEALRKLDKYRMIKQGMMQELLTGKTRLI